MWVGWGQGREAIQLFSTSSPTTLQEYYKKYSKTRRNLQVRSCGPEHHYPNNHSTDHHDTELILLCCRGSFSPKRGYKSLAQAVLATAPPCTMSLHHTMQQVFANKVDQARPAAVTWTTTGAISPCNVLEFDNRHSLCTHNAIHRRLFICTDALLFHCSFPRSCVSTVQNQERSSLHQLFEGRAYTDRL